MGGVGSSSHSQTQVELSGLMLDDRHELGPLCRKWLSTAYNLICLVNSPLIRGEVGWFISLSALHDGAKAHTGATGWED